MSKSPKYTTAEPAAQRERELEERRRQRELERQRREEEEEARQRRLEADRAALLRDAEEALARMRAEASQAQSALRELVDEARSAGASLTGDAAAEEVLAALAAAVDDEDVPRALSLAAQARQAVIRLEREFDGWLDQLDRVQLVFEAVARALPRAGFTILADSYAVSGASVTVTAERSDGSVVQLAVVPDEANGVEIAYHADGTDFVVEQTAHGEVARCDLTEEILERFHVELAAEDVVTGELRWEGKPATRPDAREAKKYWKPASQSRQTR
jgi:hypothetical protein